MRYVYTVSAALAAKAIAQTALFQLKIFLPSRMPNGIRLKTAMKALNDAIQ